MKKIIWKVLKEDDPVFKQGFIISTHNKNRQDYIKHREKTENKKNLFLEPVGDSNSSREDIVQKLIKVLIKNGWKFTGDKNDSN